MKRFWQKESLGWTGVIVTMLLLDRVFEIVSRAMSKVRGQNKGGTKPQQPVGFLGEVMLKNGRELGEDSTFGTAMVEMGESLRQLSEVKDAFDLNVRQNFLDPLDHLKNKDLK
ncbi:endophilin-A3-like, partial [Patiria miniata]|uniref:BAR domain-containing protein n=1 Tax=Patiria miniata TaxID=46514 RepID=A0A914B0Q6_PATMI